LREVVLEDLLERFAFERHETLVELPAFHVFEGDRKAPVPQQLSLVRRHHFLFFVVRHAADLELRGAVGHQQLDRARTLHLQRHPTGAFLIRPEQDIQCGGMTEQSCDIFRVVPAVQHPLPGLGEADQAPSNVQILEEKSLNVIRLHDSKV
jgi:hypothetical protein